MEEENLELEKLQKDLEEAKAKCEEYLNGWKRERADFLNYKKNEVDKLAEIVKYSNEDLLLKIIPILDNIYLAETHVPAELQDSDWIKGFNQIKTQLEEFLKKEGIDAIKTIGEKFDPNLMEAVGETAYAESFGESKGETVSEEVQRGYTMHGKIIRVAKVRISK